MSHTISHPFNELICLDYSADVRWSSQPVKQTNGRSVDSSMLDGLLRVTSWYVTSSIHYNSVQLHLIVILYDVTNVGYLGYRRLCMRTTCITRLNRTRHLRRSQIMAAQGQYTTASLIGSMKVRLINLT